MVTLDIHPSEKPPKMKELDGSYCHILQSLKFNHSVIINERSLTCGKSLFMPNLVYENRVCLSEPADG